MKLFLAEGNAKERKRKVDLNRPEEACHRFVKVEGGTQGHRSTMMAAQG
jgi:hypothetical protein